jgi:antitoxin MazE
MRTRVGKLGNNLVLRIPQALAAKVGLSEGVEVEVICTSECLLIRKRKYTLQELLKKITLENCHSESDFGPPVGREQW